MPTGKGEEVIQQIRESKGENPLRIVFRDFGIFIIENHVIAFIIAFIVANASNDLIYSLTRFLLHYFGIKKTLKGYAGELFVNTITFLVVVFFSFFFFYYILQRLLITREVKQEVQLKAVITKAEEKEIEEKAEQIT
jgi:hypothetical protein